MARRYHDVGAMMCQDKYFPGLIAVFSPHHMGCPQIVMTIDTLELEGNSRILFNLHPSTVCQSFQATLGNC